MAGGKLLHMGVVDRGDENDADRHALLLDGGNGLLEILGATTQSGDHHQHPGIRHDVDILRLS